MATRKKGECPKCHKVVKLTSHHIVPKRHGTDGVIGRLCRGCHDVLEDHIWIAEGGGRKRLPNKRYYSIWNTFIGLAVVGLFLIVAFLAMQKF